MGFDYNIDNIYTSRYINSRSNQIFFKRQTEQKDNELKEHREQIKYDINNLIQDLQVKPTLESYIPYWRKEVELSPIVIKIHEDLENHLKKSKFKNDDKDLLKNILELQDDVKSHNNEVEKFRNGLKILVENKFRENGFIPNQNPNRGFYFEGEYGELLIHQLDNIIASIKKKENLNELKEKLQKINFNRNENGFVTMMGKLIGNIEESEEEKMKKLLKDIPFDETIINPLKGFNKKVLDIEEKSNKITGELSKIADKIERNHYKTKAKCCPKKFIFF
jgi:hypothetical protein